MGRGNAALAGARDLFVTHGHLDHALGVPFVLSQRTLHHESGTRVFCPRAIAEDLAALVAAAERLERVAYRYQLVGLEPGERVELGRELAIEAFATDHVVPSLGYQLLRRRRHLKPEFRALDGAELADLRARRQPIEEEHEERWLAYCGDTGPDLWELAPRLVESRVLVVECTFLGDALRQRGTAYRHLHLDDLVARRAELARHEAILLHHLSRRHAPEELRREIDARLPELAGRIHVLGEGAR